MASRQGRRARTTVIVGLVAGAVAVVATVVVRARRPVGPQPAPAPPRVQDVVDGEPELTSPPRR